MKNKKHNPFEQKPQDILSPEFYSIPLIGEVHLEDEWGPGDYSLGELIQNFRRKETRYLTLRAADDGLIDDGILPGDFLTVDFQTLPASGEIGAVQLGERIYVRKIFFQKKLVRLETSSANPSPLIIDPELPGFQILGKVITVIREL
ncbi:MAG TPA: hypothetical protein ENJ89_07965 [Caldithrix abyssi]|uniref:Peptidase S24/S26A/S26B/S26C domain-containing protein n=1 Tax=Caldithrix abyssi TaxID=187145 RepID=A0A7V5PQ04_CALAY|nr:hypothetical protein [Caldithrix abyssi]